MSIEDKLAKATKTLCLAEPFYGIFMMMLNKKWDPGAESLQVSKDSINYYLRINPLFFESLTDLWKIGVIKHEMLHIAFFHLELYDKYPDKKLLNIAMDMEVNQYIDSKYLPGYDMSVDQFKAKYNPVIRELQEKLKSGEITANEYEKDILAIPPRGIYLKDFKELNLQPKGGTDYYYYALQQAGLYKPDHPRYSKTLDELLNDSEPSYRDWETDRKSTRLNSSHITRSRMPSSA